jgi:hypothetical protein
MLPSLSHHKSCCHCHRLIVSPSSQLVVMSPPVTLPPTILRCPCIVIISSSILLLPPCHCHLIILSSSSCHLPLTPAGCHVVYCHAPAYHPLAPVPLVIVSSSSCCLLSCHPSHHHCCAAPCCAAPCQHCATPCLCCAAPPRCTANPHIGVAPQIIATATVSIPAARQVGSPHLLDQGCRCLFCNHSSPDHHHYHCLPIPRR